MAKIYKIATKLLMTIDVIKDLYEHQDQSNLFHDIKLENSHQKILKH